MNEILVVVDAQKDFVSGVLGSQAAIDALPHVCAAIRDPRYESIFVTMDTHKAETYKHTLEGELLPVAHTLVGTPGWELETSVLEALRDTGDRCVVQIPKRTFGYVNIVHPILDRFAWQAEKDYNDLTTDEQYVMCDNADLSITIVGYCTDICVVSNALILRAFFPNAPIRVIAKACAGSSPERHRAALETMKSCQIEVIEEE